MTTRPPTTDDFAALLSFLPTLSADDFAPIDHWSHGTSADGVTPTLSWPQYNRLVEAFIEVASRECWRDRHYDPDVAGRLLDSPDAVATADLAQVKAMLTYCVRGERFCEGHWGALISEGKVQRLLRRVAALSSA